MSKINIKNRILSSMALLILTSISAYGMNGGDGFYFDPFTQDPFFNDGSEMVVLPDAIDAPAPYELEPYELVDYGQQVDLQFAPPAQFEEQAQQQQDQQDQQEDQDEQYVAVGSIGNIRGHQCFDCGKIFKSQWLLNRHIRVHTGEKPYGCQECDKKFTERGHLTDHMRIHTGEKPFACETCGKRFSKKSHLNSHRHIHTGEKLYGCPECDKRFTESGHLNRHMRIHIKPFSLPVQLQESAQQDQQQDQDEQYVAVGSIGNIRGYQCSYRDCGKICTYPSGLKIHMRIHTKEKPYECSWLGCGKRFSHKSNLTKHMRIHTREKP